MGIEIDTSALTKGLDEIAKKKMKSIVKEIDKSMNEWAMKTEADAVSFAPEHDGELKQNIGYKADHLSEFNLRYIVYANAPHSASVEFGTRPHFVSAKHLKKWAKDKLGDENLAYAVASKIAKKGTKAQPFMRTAFYKNESWGEEELKKAIKRGLKK